ncbi:MAG: hypothetical protein ACRDRK_02300 [Pseudonocardia sp.]
MTFPVAVHVAADAPLEDVDQLLDDLRVFGLNPTCHLRPTRRGAIDLAWVLLLALPTKLFFETLTEELAGDAYLRLKAIVGRALRRRREPENGNRVLMLEDATTGLQIVLEPDLPAEAYQRLFHTDLSTFARGPLHYDRSAHRWRSELDEWERQNPPRDDHDLDPRHERDVR